jgi:hypothetical protein
MSKAAELAKMGEVLTNSQIGGRRNMVINRAMQVAQRGTSASGLGGTNNDYQTVDRFKIIGGTAISGRVTMSQSDSGLSGFKKCLKLDVTTADTSIGASELFGLVTAIEGQDLQQLKKGTSDAEQITVSYYVKGNAAANYTFEISDADNTRHNTQSFSVTSDWTRVVHTFAADTTGALDNDNATSFSLAWWLHAGSNFTSGTFTENTWASRTSANRVDSNDTSIFDSTSRTFEITGVQMEVGSTATPFEHRSFGEELALCQRYFCKTFQYEQAPAQNPTNKLNAISGPAASNSAYDNILQWWMTVKLRAAPTVTTFNPYASNANFAQSGSDGPTANLYSSGENSVSIRDDSGGYQGTNLQIHATADAEL